MGHFGDVRQYYFRHRQFLGLVLKTKHNKTKQHNDDDDDDDNNNNNNNKTLSYNREK